MKNRNALSYLIGKYKPKNIDFDIPDGSFSPKKIQETIDEALETPEGRAELAKLMTSSIKI